MSTPWTFGRKLAFGFALVVTVTILVGGIGVYALSRVVAAKDEVIDGYGRRLIDARHLEAETERKSGKLRGFLISGNQDYVDAFAAAQRSVATLLDHLDGLATEEGRRQIAAIRRDDQHYDQVSQEIIALHRSGAPLDEVARAFEAKVAPAREALLASLGAFIERRERMLVEARAAASDDADTASTLLVIAVGLAIVLAALAAWLLTRGLSRQIGSAIVQVQLSSTELQAASTQQASATREQATAMAEIATTITQLLTTSRQIAESAQSVARIAAQTNTAAATGESTILHARDALAQIRQQVDTIVQHMLELGRSSQQIGVVLDIVGELAEQTNILAINASIEAAGAGDAGRRFGVVADEVRKLADRVSASTKEIRELIDGVRSRVNTTVMATETGAKAVDAGWTQIAAVSSAFQEIAGMVTTTTDASREIELSTKQQSSAVEQVNVAVASVTQATLESEASASQTLATASQLATLSRGLTELVRTEPGFQGRT